MKTLITIFFLMSLGVMPTASAGDSCDTVDKNTIALSQQLNKEVFSCSDVQVADASDDCRAACFAQSMTCRAGCSQADEASWKLCKRRCSAGGQACQNRC